MGLSVPMCDPQKKGTGCLQSQVLKEKTWPFFQYNDRRLDSGGTVYGPRKTNGELNSLFVLWKKWRKCI